MPTVPQRQLSPGEVAELKRLAAEEAQRARKKGASNQVHKFNRFIITPPQKQYESYNQSIKRMMAEDY